MKEEYGGETTFQKKFEQRADGIEIKGIPSSLVKMSECPEKNICRKRSMEVNDIKSMLKLKMNIFLINA